MIKIFKKTHHSSVFDLNETTGQVEETTATPLSPSAAFNLDPTEGDASYDKDSGNPIVFYIDSNGYLVTESNVRAVAKKLQYSGTFMEIPVLSITVSSPAPIQWEIGDYILWDYDNQVYTLKNIPQVRKQARANSYGEAFVYENMQFVSVLSDLKTLEFLDVILESPATANYTTLPAFSFFGDCYALIDRINANLGRLYANWEVLAADVESGDIYDALHTERNVVISAPMKVWEAMGLFYSMWGLGFVYSYNSIASKHNITIGATGGETGNFAYGQGNGLRMIGQSLSKDDSIVTRLRAYGSTRNMPSRYYNNKVILIDRQLFTDPMVYLPNLMIPYWKWAYTNGDPKDAYINCNNTDVDATDTSYAKYGIREASVFFDGTNGLPDIYPTIERITAKNIRDGIAALQYESEEYPLYHSPSGAIYPDTERMDLVKLGDTLSDNGVVVTTEIYTQTATFAGDTANYPTTIESFTLAFDPIYSKTLAKEGEFKATLNSQEVVLSGVDTTIDSAKLKMWLTKNGSRSVLVTTIEGSAVGGVFTFVLPDFTFATQEEGDTYAVEVDIDITIPPIGELGIANVNYAFEAGSLTYELTKITPITTFAINVKQIGFDIKRFLPNAGQSPVISMTSGACQGREFIIKDTRYNSATDDWTLTCARQSDTSLSNQWFPNANFHIAQGDSFVVLNINMPEFFINIAEERLYTAACDWLRKRKEPKWVFEPKVDAVYMAYNPQLIKEGMMMPLSDDDLGLSDSKLINTVTITENERSIRTFDVVLREDADKDLLKYINEAAKRESSAAVGSITNADTSKSESAEKQSVVVTSSSGTAPTELSNASTSATPNTLVLRTADADVNVRDINASRKVKGATLILPQSAPTLAGGEMAIYGLESGFSGEIPSGAGSVTSISMVVPTGLSVTPETITESGTFTIGYASGYSIPTNTKQGEWDTAYNDKINSVTLTSSALTLTQQDGGTVVVNVPTFNQNTTGSAATLTTPRAINISVSGVSGTAQNFNGSEAVTIPVTLTTLTRGSYLTGNNYNGGTATTWAVDATTAATANKIVARDANADIFVRDLNASRKVKGATLILPQVAPTLDSGEVGIYSLDSGFSGEMPSGAGSVESVALVSNLTGISVTGSPITTSGTFTLNFVAGYSIPTNTKQGEWDNAYTNRITSLTTTGSGAATLIGNVLNIPTCTLPTATASILGGVKIGSNITITDGVISVAAPYALPTATGSVLGGVKIGTNVSITDGVVSVHNPITLGTANGLSLSTQVLSLGLASASANGALSSTDWSTFNGKQAKLIGTGASSLVRVNTLGVIAYDDSTYLTGNQTITLSGIVTGSGTTAITTAIADGALSIAKTNGLQTALDAKMTTTSYPDLTAIEALTGTSGFLKKTAANTWALDTNSYALISGATTQDFQVKALTMNGALSGATTGSFSGNVSATSFTSGGNAVIHAGNIGSQSVGNAVTWNGLQIALATYTSGTVSSALVYNSTNGRVEFGTWAQYKTFLGLGASAFHTDTYYALLAGNSSQPFAASTLTMTENINTNLRIPKVAPTSPTSGQYYFYIVE